jgi:hypothetical protein
MRFVSGEGFVVDSVYLTELRPLAAFMPEVVTIRTTFVTEHPTAAHFLDAIRADAPAERRAIDFQRELTTLIAIDRGPEAAALAEAATTGASACPLPGSTASATGVRCRCCTPSGTAIAPPCGNPLAD